MDFEKRSSKGSFLQLFDWNVKSRKKLFSTKSELSEKSTQGKENVDDFSFPRLQQLHENGSGPSSGFGEKYILKYGLPLSSDETYGTKAPGVVARLMGLDSLPTSYNVEPYSTPFLDSQSFRDSRYSAGILGSQGEERVIISNSMRNKLDGFTKNPMELMLQKVHSRPIERFQTEVLPPKSAKPISITHHRLLSPVKSPGFVPTLDAAYLMEAAAKIIEQSPRARITHKLPSLGPSSAPLRIQDLKERVETAYQMGKEQNFDQYSYRHARGRRQGHIDSPDLLRTDQTVKTPSSEDLKKKKKATTSDLQAKTNSQNRDGLASIGDQGSASLKQRTKAKCGFVGRSQEKNQKNVEKKTPLNRQTPMTTRSDVLRQNDQKQNCASTKERGSVRPSLPNEEEKKPSSSIASLRPSKTVNRIVVNSDSLSKKTNQQTPDSRKETASSMRKSSSRKKQDGTRNRASNGGKVASLSQECNQEVGKASKWESADQKNGMNVVSFTFTSPIKKPVPESSLSGKRVESKRNLSMKPDSCSSQSSLVLDVGSSDELSMLLEQKIKELACRVESSHQDRICSEFLCSADASRDSVLSFETKNFEKSGCESKNDPPGGKKDMCFHFEAASSSSLTEPRPESMQKWQGSDSIQYNEKELQFEYSAPLSSLEPSYSEGSYKSMDSSRSISSEGSKQYFSVEAPDVELLDSASSSSHGTTSITEVTSTYTFSILKDSSNWEFDYVRSIIFSVDLKLEEYALGQEQKIIPEDLFDRLENEKSARNHHSEGNLKLRRKTLFHYVGESLESRCASLMSGARKNSMKLTMLLHEKDWLVDELCREISGWTSMEELMVDEVVDKDMSTQLGRWIDFEVEAFDEGVEIGKGILAALVDEMVDDLFLC